MWFMTGDVYSFLFFTFTLYFHKQQYCSSILIHPVCSFRIGFEKYALTFDKA